MTRRTALLLASVALAVVLALPASLRPAGAGETAQASDAAAIRSRLTGWAEAFNAGDASRVCDLFADDLQSDVETAPVGDKASVCARLKTALAKPDRRLTYTVAIHDILVSGDMAAVRLTWTSTLSTAGKNAAGESESWAEQGLDVFRRDPDGAWRIVRYMAYGTR
ncbi:YybH family protein [Xanthobacter autotrophicus]|uniref:YybH family protein n=1 Tax=Xanthobacter autotrophicus TaxID=280 RepID=UPI0024A701FD|nr:nuclear transport factor 2 family protein [Xanthobacter autotrophicus]MDI4657324.1 nuclear transport factor 2 family protein [Xanthobacter autotrophicus]